jgi:hypothetical protein
MIGAGAQDLSCWWLQSGKLLAGGPPASPRRAWLDAAAGQETGLVGAAQGFGTLPTSLAVPPAEGKARRQACTWNRPAPLSPRGEKPPRAPEPSVYGPVDQMTVLLLLGLALAGRFRLGGGFCLLCATASTLIAHSAPFQRESTSDKEPIPVLSVPPRGAL